MIPALFPVFNFKTETIKDGGVVPLNTFCKKEVKKNQKCLNFYKSLSTKPTGYYQCPSGFTCCTFYFQHSLWAITGVVACPRFDTADERAMAKRFPDMRVTRSVIDDTVNTLRKLDVLRMETIQGASMTLPQAFHELRKLNAAVLHHAEIETRAQGETPFLVTVFSAAELMRNNFEMLAVLANPESMYALPKNETIDLFALFYLSKRVFNATAKTEMTSISVDGLRPVIYGSRKLFSVVATVLVQNAIKYGRKQKTIHIKFSTLKDKAVITVENQTDFFIDPVHCFEKGRRFAGDTVEGGGFGLYLAKEIVLAHNGIIHCEYELERVRFVVELPLVKVLPPIDNN